MRDAIDDEITQPPAHQPAPAAHDSIFISYHRADAPLARALAAAIAAAGGDAWLDETHLQPGDVISDRVLAALDVAPIVVVLVTSIWREREGWYAPEEVDRAIDRVLRRGQGRIVPMLYDGASPDALPYGLFRLKALEVARDDWTLAAHILVGLLGGDSRPIDEPAPGDVPADHRTALIRWLDDIADRFDDVPALTPGVGGRCLSTLFVRLDQREISEEAREALMGRGLSAIGRPLDDLLRANPTGRWTIQGDPGAGKTTQLRHLAMERAREARDELRQGRLGAARIPIFVALAVLDLRSAIQPDADAITVAVEDHGQHAVARHPPALLEAALRWAVGAGRALLLLDGFDEVRPESVESMRRRIATIERSSPAACIVVTSRRFGYVAPNERFGELELLPLSPASQRDLLSRWNLSPERIDAVMTQVAGRPALQDMAGNPFVLTLMALLARESDEPLPAKRVALYRKVIELLVRGRIGPGSGRPSRTGLPPEHLRHILAELALALLQDHAGPWTAEELDHHLIRIAPSAPLFDRLDNVPLAIEADTGLLVAMGHHYDRRRTGWRFLHRSLMECLTAEALHARGEAAARQFAVQLSGGRWYAPWTWGRTEQIGRWAEVYCHLAAMTDQPARFLAGIEKVHPQLAMRAWMSLDAVPLSDLVSDHIDLRRVDLTTVRLLIEAVPDRVALARVFLRLARANAGHLEGLQYITAGLMAIGADTALDVMAAVAGGWDLIGARDPGWSPIAPGEFVMGSPTDEEGRQSDEGPLRWVRIKRGLYFATTPVTQALYAVVTGQNPSRFVGDLRRPVEQVNWYEANIFCMTLSTLQGRTIRLPSEAEWEYACRAGTTTRFWRGNHEADLLRVAWFAANSSGSTHPVAQKEANAWGLHDMHGNVREWCGEASPARPEGARPDGGGSRLRPCRGGSWADLACNTRSAFRSEVPADLRSHGLGFRVVIDQH